MTVNRTRKPGVPDWDSHRVLTPTSVGSAPKGPRKSFVLDVRQIFRPFPHQCRNVTDRYRKGQEYCDSVPQRSLLVGLSFSKNRPAC